MNIANDFKDKALLIGWIFILLFFIIIIFKLTVPVQTHNLLRTVNAALISSSDERRLISYDNQNKIKTGLMGYWYNMLNSKDKMFVFAIFQDGILIPLGAVVSENGNVAEIMPLSAHAIQIYDNLSKNILLVYSNRIETAVRSVKEGRIR